MESALHSTRWVLLSVCCLVSAIGAFGANGANINETKALHAYLMNGYNKDVRPVINQRNVVDVGISLHLLAFQEFDEVLEKFSVVGYFVVNWCDENFIWNTSSYSHINDIRFGCKDVWVPEIILTNPSQKLDTFGAEWQQVRFTSNGLGVWYPGDLIKATCSVNVYYFPYDIQECNIELYPWGYGVHEVKLRTTMDTIDTSKLSAMGSWTIVSTRAKVEISKYLSKAIFTICLKRKPDYVIVNIMFPILFLCLLNLLVFVLPPASGERISYSITVLLSIAVFMTIVSDNLPKLSEPVPLVSYLLLTCLIVSALMTSVAVINLRLYHKKSDSTVPAWLVTVFHAMNCRWKIECKENLGKSDEKKKTIVETILRPDTKVLPFVPSKDDGAQNCPSGGESDSDVTWQDISSMVDKLSVIVSLSIIAISFSIFFIVTISRA